MNSDIRKIYELLDCPICLEKLDHINKVLPCQHTFCKMCLYKIESNADEVSCPECRFVYSGKIDDLPSNIFLIRILNKCEEIKRLSNSSEDKKNSQITINNEGGHLQFSMKQNDISMNRFGRPVLKAVRKLIHSNIPTSHHFERPMLKAARRYTFQKSFKIDH